MELEEEKGKLLLKISFKKQGFANGSEKKGIWERKVKIVKLKSGENRDIGTVQSRGKTGLTTGGRRKRLGSVSR